MDSALLSPRWAAPPSIEVHPRYALVRHGGRLYAFSELLRHVPAAYLTASADILSRSPQLVWDELAQRVPRIVGQAIAASRPRDFEILDLYGAEAVGTA